MFLCWKEQRKIIHRRVCLFTQITAGCLFISCQQNCDASVEPPKCPPPVTCPNAQTQQTQLTQLDPDTREKLKAEFKDEFQSEIRAELRRELEQEFQKELDRIQTQTNSDKKPNAIPAAIPPTQKIEKDSGGLKILRQVFSTQIQHRLPVDEREAFTIADTSIYCFVEIASAEEIERTITIRFTHSTGLTQSYTLPVSQSPAWRTWSKLNLTKSMTGTWLCEVFNEDGTLLASKPFVIVDE